MDLSTFNDAQKEVILLPISPAVVPDILVVAGAGSGKTRVLVHRIAYLRENFVDPKSILAMTFTKKAAKEMKERVAHLLQSNEPIYISTFHAMSADLLRKFMGSKFDILDANEQDRLIKSLIKEHGLSKDVVFKEFDQWLSLQRSKCETPEKDQRDDSEDVKRYRMLARLYRKAKQNIGLGVLDFDDLLEHLVELLQRNPDIQKQLHNKWKYILVDEYQDTNRIQFKLLGLLRAPDAQLLQVGDEDQLIYSWRGAEIEHILASYKRSLHSDKVHCVMLKKNYRCSANILRVANDVVGQNSQRTGKTLDAHKNPGNPVQVRRFENEKEEADYIAQQIESWHENGVPYDHMAVLMRTNRMAKALERALIRSRLPYHLHAGVAMFDTQEVRLAMAMLQLTQFPTEVFYLQHIASVITCGLGPATLQKLDEQRRAKEQDWFAFLSEHPKFSNNEHVNSFIVAYRAAKPQMEKGNLVAALQCWLLNVDITDHFDEESQENREMTLLSLVHLVENYEEQAKKEGKTPSFLGFQESRLLDDSLTDGQSDGAVHIMTVHKAKGLEFRCGVLMGLQDGVFPMREPDEEDTRLAYVGITRFMEDLLITRADYRVGFHSVMGYSTILDPHLRSLTDDGVVKYVR